MLGVLCSSQTAEHDVSQAQVDVGAAAGKGGFVFTAEQSVTPQPSMKNELSSVGCRQWFHQGGDSPRRRLRSVRPLARPGLVRHWWKIL